MQAELLHVETIASTGEHHAFTSLCRWRERYYCAYRTAMAHSIIPPGHITIRSTAKDGMWMPQERTITHPSGDMRDPRFLPTTQALFLMCGIYLPHPAYDGPPCLRDRPDKNILQTHLTFTVDGTTWAPLTPILRPGHWGWSTSQHEDRHLIAAYYTGSSGDTSSIHLWSTRTCFTTGHLATMYDGINLAREGDIFQYLHVSPSEPVLYQPTSDTLACCLRTEDTMEIGVARFPYQDWRWHNTHQILHPSAVLQTAHGWLLAARDVSTRQENSLRHDILSPERLTTRIMTSTSLWHIDAQFLEPLLFLNSDAGDTGYAGLAHGPEPDTILVSYYDQARYNKQGEYGSTLPSADVHVATVRITA